MKRIFQYILSASVATMAFVACSDLDTEPMGGTVTTKQKENVYSKNPEMVAASVTGITNMFSVFGNLTGTTDPDHDDFGYGGTMHATDCRGEDMVSPAIGYNWFRGYLEWKDCTYNSGYATMHWRTLYNQIYAANQVTALIDSTTTDPQLQYYLAQAYGIRAFDYFMLAQLFQFTYKGHEDLPCVPIITEENANEAAADGCDLSTVGKVYEQITKDIDNTIELLKKSGIARSDKRYLNLAAATALRARINLVKEEWAAAAADAKAVIESGEFTPYTIAELKRPSFIDMKDK